MKAGLDSVRDGAFALECPACPHPGRNLPEKWEQVSEDERYVCLCSHPSRFKGLNVYQVVVHGFPCR